jgi:Trk K+ transport system NAD-binding subunit
VLARQAGGQVCLRRMSLADRWVGVDGEESMARTVRAASVSPHNRRRHYGAPRLIRANLYDLFILMRRSGVALIGFLVVVFSAAAYLNLVSPSHLPVANALYESLRLLIFQSGLPLPGDPLGAALFFLVPILGLLLVAQSVLTFGRGLLDKGSRLQSWQVSLASTYSNHVIVCGLGRVGFRVVTRLIDAGYDPIVIESKWEGEHVARVVRMKVPVIVGDARDRIILRQARLRQARALIADINGDLTNIEIALAARAIRPDIRVILRAFDEDLDRRLERTFGANSAFSASALAAPTFTAAAVSREIDYVLPLGEDGALLGVTQLVVRKEGLLPETAQQLEAEYGVRVVQVDSSVPRNIDRARLHAGTTLTLLGTLAALEAARVRNVQSPSSWPPETIPQQHPTMERDTVIVCGLGKVGYRVVRRLYSLTPRLRIVVINLGDEHTAFVRQVRRMEGVTYISGDASDVETLRAAGIDRAYSVAVLTSDDAANLRIGLAARGERPDVHVVLRVFSDALADQLVTLFGIRTTYSTSDLAGPTLAAAAVLSGISRAFYAGGTLFATDEVTVDDSGKSAGRTIADLRTKRQVVVIAIQRQGQLMLMPPAETQLMAGDELALLAPLDVLRSLRDGGMRKLLG